ncbi:MAG: CYTH domain-containing protein [Patescibacteria group bacterium]
MAIEYEATFTNINKDEMRARLRQAGANLIKPEFLQKRVVFNLPSGHEIPGGWLRVRDEQDQITMSLKIINGAKIEDQEEICLKVDNFSEAVDFLTAIGAQRKAYQESRRELWLLDGVEITLDEWPYLEPYIEIEGKSEEAVKKASAKLNFDYGQALFCGITTLYHNKYGLDEDYINNYIERVTFDDANPFIKTKNN